jgi:hypothetical protein
MPIVRSVIEIDAPAEKIFDILVDLDAYADWNPFTPRVESTLAIGDPIHLQARLGKGDRLTRQVEYVTANERPHKLCWGADIGARFLIRADRCQMLTSLGEGRTRYECTDDIRGLLAGLVMVVYRGGMQRGFDACARALKARAEGG